jgi:hypothetical protein
MSSLFKQFKTDLKKEQEGIPVTYAANEDGSIPTFHVRRRGPTNPQWTKALERESAPYRRLLELGTLDPKIGDRIMLRVFCSSVLTGWENVQGQKNESRLAYTLENAIQLFTELPELYLDLSEQAGKLAGFRIETQESDAKN